MRTLSNQAKAKDGARRRSHPELSLPFVKPNHPPRGGNGKVLDYWAPPKVKRENGLDPEFRGDLYARLAVRHMRRHPDGYQLLLNINGSMVDKGKFKTHSKEVSG